MKYFNLLIFVCVCMASCGTQANHTETKEVDASIMGSPSSVKTSGSVINITGDEAVLLSQNGEVKLIDVRTPEEVADGYIKGTEYFYDFRNAEFQKEIDSLDKSKTYMVYCRSGARSSEAANQMVKMGFQKIYNLEGGILNWQGEISHPE